MTAVGIVATVAYIALNIFSLVMWARLILDLAQTFARHWRPRGFLLVVAEVVYTVTDPPVKAVRRVLPPVRVGAVALDFAWTIVMFLCIILTWIVSGFIK